MGRRLVRLRAKPLIDALRRLYDSGMRLPVFRVGGYTLALDPSTGRLYASRGRRKLGEVRVSGLYRPTPGAWDKDIENIQVIVEHSLDVARGAAILLGMNARCAVCNRKLDSKDTLRGIGARCYEKGQFHRLGEKETNTKRTRSVRLGSTRETATDWNDFSWEDPIEHENFS